MKTLRNLTRLLSLLEGSLSHTPCRTTVCQRTIYYRHLSSRSCLPALGIQSHTQPRVIQASWSVVPVRLKGSKTSKKGSKKVVEEEEDEDDDPEKSDYEDEPEHDPSVPKDYKDLEKAVQSFRYDLMMKAGLDMARNKVEDAFYSNKLRLNGQKLIKKSKTVKVGDTLDLVVEEDKETDIVTVMRVVFKTVSGETTGTDRYRVVLRRWKNLKLPKQDVYK
ncbi:mitochondrial transcription rescue factor 1 [Polyodon spathula]|uniref:mitochondrial transcription rescue factor 1 n=1 Tax=Polyodon spathula TaxID=7913 RepID=UPI001B7EE30A|nr:mitochondrial transcription rescue factor 1 [Polyodon spathula]XP_041107208.1 mitochondrial transcription rescue factor 1 [Polyodon spathula]